MEKFLKRKASSGNNSTSTTLTEVDLDNLPSDPSERKRISQFHPNQRDEVRRKYMLKGSCQPRGHDFPRRMIGNKGRRFNPAWFDQYGNWLEYSVKTDKAFCLCCYLFRDQCSGQGQGGNDAFVTDGFNSWNKTERLVIYVGDINSCHNRALKKCEDLVRQNQSIVVAFHKQNEIVKNEYSIRLNASIDAARFLLNSALPFRGHDESEESLHRGNFLELVKLIGNQNEVVGKVTLGNAPGNNQMVSPSIQKDIVHCFAQEVLKYIFEEIGDDVFSLLVDESSDISKKEQMAVVLRYVKCGIVKERFVGIVHVMDTSALSLKSAIESLFAEHGLSMKKAISLVKSTKRELQQFRVDGFCQLLEKISSFCNKHNIEMVIMEDVYVNQKNRREKTNITYRHYYEFDCFNTVVDMQIQEFGDRFDEVSSELLTCMASLNPHYSFCDFDPSKLLKLTEFYKDDFSDEERRTLEHQLRLYIDNVKQDERFGNLKGISDLGRVMVETRKHLVFPLVYRLLKLALVLPVATATVERCFSAMKIVKTTLRNRICDGFLNGCVICAVEKEGLAHVTNEDVMTRFQMMKTRREQL